jgi:hypothetical protein
MPKVIMNWMKWAFVALMCLESVAAANDPAACIPCGCEIRQLIFQTEKPDPSEGYAFEDGPGSWMVYKQCHESKFPKGANVQEHGQCGVGGDIGKGANYCAGCAKTPDGALAVVYANECPVDDCRCLWEGTTLPEAAWVAPTINPATQKPVGAGNPLVGTYCRDWNILPGVVDHIPDTTCPKSKMCTPACNWQQNAWCYVREGCATHHHKLTSVETLVPYGAAYSYEICGSANCFDNIEDGKFTGGSNCPEGPGCDYYHHCECLFEGTTLPASVSTVVGNPLYGTNCEIAWDLLPGTKSYTEHPECMEGEKYEGKDVDPDKCSKECNWHYNHWCFVEMGCPGLAAEDIILSKYSDDLVVAAGIKYPSRQFPQGIGYSYAMCGSANCYGSTAFDTNPDCPFGEDCLTCGMVKHDYKQQECCDHPTKEIHIHHVFHEGMASSLHEGDQTWHLPHPKDTHF